VARVGGHPITKAAFDHWLSIQVAANGQRVSKHMVPSVVLKQRVLGFLISSEWTAGEATELGVSVTGEEALKQLERFRYAQLYGLGYERFPKEADLQKSLVGLGETRSDQLWLMKLNMLASRLEHRRSSRARRQIERRWIARTSCGTGYVVPKCKQYMGATPAASNSPYFANNTIGSMSASTSAGTMVSTKHVKMGTILGAGPKKLTVYLFEVDKGSTSACYGACARIWPPVTTTGAPTVGGEAIPADLGTITRSDGVRQVTYFHHPLYYYAKDKYGGDVYGQGIKSFGADWYALRTIGVKFDESLG
jgi:predicted lipoprotein with Yx(FWY)xxD motif